MPSKCKHARRFLPSIYYYVELRLKLEKFVTNKSQDEVKQCLFLMNQLLDGIDIKISNWSVIKIGSSIDELLSLILKKLFRLFQQDEYDFYSLYDTICEKYLSKTEIYFESGADAITQIHFLTKVMRIQKYF